MYGDAITAGQPAWIGPRGAELLGDLEEIDGRLRLGDVLVHSYQDAAFLLNVHALLVACLFNGSADASRFNGPDHASLGVDLFNQRNSKSLWVDNQRLSLQKLRQAGAGAELTITTVQKVLTKVVRIPNLKIVFNQSA